MINWIKPDGEQAQSNDRKESIEALEKAGWKRVEPRRKRRTKAEMEEARANGEA